MPWDNQGFLAIPVHWGEKYDVCMLFLRITAVESLRIRGLQNSSARTCESIKGCFPIWGLLDYAIKIAATWVACKNSHARIARPFTLRIQHRTIFKMFRLLFSNLWSRFQSMADHSPRAINIPHLLRLKIVKISVIKNLPSSRLSLNQFIQVLLTTWHSFYWLLK